MKREKCKFTRQNGSVSEQGSEGEKGISDRVMSKAEQAIKETIREKGPITFEEFMDKALYHPLSGYYTSGRQRVGVEEDYYTAPYATSVMSMIVARQIAQFYDLLGKPEPFHVLEVGAGSGRMADDILESLKIWHKELYERTKYIIVEKTKGMNVQHRDKIDVYESLNDMDRRRDIAPKVQSFPAGLTGCILSNELFDALPVHIVAMKDKLYEVYVGMEDDHFEELLLPASEELLNHFDFLGIRPAEGMWTEVNLKARDMLRAMSDVLKRGYLLTIDYGYTASEYYAPHRINGTLVCYHNHKIDDNPYELVGEKDITSHVDFTSLEKWGREFSLNTVGYVRQRDFILSLGYDDLLMKIKNTVSDPVDYYRLTSASKFLIMPDAMGDIFKVLLQYKGDTPLPVPAGFTCKNSSL